jgi:hypothetical protein
LLERFFEFRHVGDGERFGAALREGIAFFSDGFLKRVEQRAALGAPVDETVRKREEGAADAAVSGESVNVPLGQMGDAASEHAVRVVRL